MKAFSRVSGSFLFRVSGKAHNQMVEVNDSDEKMMSGSRGDICWAKSGVNGVRTLPKRPKTEQMLKNLCRRFVGKISIVKM